MASTITTGLCILLFPILLSAILLPKLVHLAAEVVGRHLRRSSNTRRELLLARVASEAKAFEAEHSEKSRDDDDWEKVGSSPVGSAINGAKADEEWDGIVGFFHPFWYERSSLRVWSDG
jgi:alpha-1,2-mannosyltransferase